MANKRILVFTQGFENYNIDDTISNPWYKFKAGSTYECIVPEDTHTGSVIARMYSFISNKHKTEQHHHWMEFPSGYEILEEEELTPLEKSYQEYGDEYPLEKLQYINNIIQQRNY